MTDQPVEGGGTGGIEQGLDSGLAADDHEDDRKPDDARSSSTVRTDPDDPVQGMQEATEASEQP